MHFNRVEQFATFWLLQKMVDLEGVWLTELNNAHQAAALDAGSAYFSLRSARTAACRAISLSYSSQALILAASDLAAYEAFCSGVS